MTHILEQLMEKVNGTTFISIDTLTNVKLTGGKKNLLQGRVTKQVTGSNVMVFQRPGYEAMVNRRLEKEGKGTFELSPRSWGTRRPNSPFIDHKGELYLEVIFLRCGETKILVDGTETDRDEIEGYPVSQGESEQSSLDNKVIIRTYKVESITGITINKQHYDL